MKDIRWFDEVYKDQYRLGLAVDNVLYDGRSELQKIDVMETPAYGRVLALDGLYMTSERDEHFYHEMLVHPAMTTARQIRRVLVIGGGDGGTVREVLSYKEVEHVSMIEIDAEVIRVSKEYLPTIGTAWGDPRLHVEVRDGIDFAQNADVPPFDVIFLDGCDPVGPATGLFTVDFYRGCARLLADGGVFALQSESPILMKGVFLEIQKTLGSVFRNVHPYFGPVPIYASGAWSWTYASQSTSFLELNESRVARQESRCKIYNRDLHRAAFALPNDIKKALGR